MTCMQLGLCGDMVSHVKEQAGEEAIILKAVHTALDMPGVLCILGIRCPAPENKYLTAEAYALLSAARHKWKLKKKIYLQTP